MKLHIQPCSLKEASDYVATLHRHHRPPQGHKFSLRLVDEESVVHGVAIAGRPVSRALDNGLTLEITRVCTDGTPNACSQLYGAMRRVAQAMGYKKVLTYTLPEEGGASLRGAGWENAGVAGGGKWSNAVRQRADDHPLQKKFRWEAAI